MPRKILVIKLRSLGDTVILTASLSALRTAYPDAEIHALVTDAWAPILENHRCCHRVLGFSRPRSLLLRVQSLLSLARKLRSERYDTVVNLHASPSSAWLARVSGAKTRAIHFHGHHDSNRGSTVEIPGKGTVKPIIERDLDTLRALSLSIAPGSLPSVVVTTEERTQAREKLQSLGLKPPVLVLGLGASRPTKQWPIERFQSLAREWMARTGGSAMAVGGEAERALAEQWKAGLPSGASVLVNAPLRLLAGILSEAAVVAGNDSGPRHLAAAVGAPTVTVFGPEDPSEWHPYPRERHPLFFIENLPCRRDAAPGKPPWCGLATCVVEAHRCMTGLEVAPVLNACQKLAGLERLP